MIDLDLPDVLCTCGQCITAVFTVEPGWLNAIMAQYCNGVDIYLQVVEVLNFL